MAVCSLPARQASYAELIRCLVCLCVCLCPRKQNYQREIDVITCMCVMVNRRSSLNFGEFSKNVLKCYHFVTFIAGMMECTSVCVWVMRCVCDGDDNSVDGVRHHGYFHLPSQ